MYRRARLISTRYLQAHGIYEHVALGVRRVLDDEQPVVPAQVRTLVQLVDDELQHAPHRLRQLLLRADVCVGMRADMRVDVRADSLAA